MQSARQLIAIALIAWFAAPVCCCTSMAKETDSSSPAPSCCQSAEDANGETDGHSGPECPCGKRTLTEGKAEAVLFAAPVETSSLIAATEWLPGSLELPSSPSAHRLYETQDLPPPHSSWFAISGSWLL